MRIWLKRIVVICLIPIVLILLVSVLLYIPAVQNIAVKKAMVYASESLGMNIGFERLRLSFPLNLSVYNAYAVSAEKDTLLHFNKLTLQVKPLPLVKGNISVSTVQLKSAVINTHNFIDGMTIEGSIEDVYIHADSICASEELVLLNEVAISNADIRFAMCDTTPDTTTSNTKWRIELGQIDLNNIKFSCQMPCDSVYTDMIVRKASLTDGFVNLGSKSYGVLSANLDAQEIFYGTDLNEAAPGLDISHIGLSDIHLALDSINFSKNENINAIIRECSARERSGLVLQSVAGRIVSDSINIRVPDFLIQTQNSNIQMQAFIPRSALDDKNPKGSMSLNINASINKEDAVVMLGNLSEDFQTYYPDTTFTIKASAEGNINKFTLQHLESKLYGAFDINLSGNMRSIKDSRKRSGEFDLEANTRDLDFIIGFLPSSVQSRFRIPDSMHLAGNLTIKGGLYTTEMLLSESQGKVLLSGNYDMFKKNYEADFNIDSLEPIHFMPTDSIMLLTANIQAKGQGIDIYKTSTEAEINGGITNIIYKNNSISNVLLTGDLKKNHFQTELVSKYPLLRGKISVDGDIKKDKISGMIIADVDTLDLYKLGFTESPFSTSFQIYSELESDQKKTHSLDITLGNWNMVLEKQTIQPKTLTFAFRSNADTTRASFHAGDLSIMLTGNMDLETLAKHFSKLAEEAERQLKRDSMINLQELRQYFPIANLKIDAARDNPLYNILQEQNMFFEHLSVNADFSPEKGVNMDGSLLSFVKDTLKIDTVQINVWQDTLGLEYTADIIKNRFRRQEAFHAGVNGYLRRGDADMFLSFVNSRGEEGFQIGVNAKKTVNGFDFHFYPENPIVMFLPFNLNKDNYFHFKSIKDMAGNLRLEGKEHASLWIHSDDNDNEKAMKEIMVEMNQINLSKISEGISNLPSLDGILNMTLRYEPTETSFMVVADANVDNLYYEKGRVGELLLNATYMPMERGEHQVDMHLFHDQAEISSLSVLYKEGRYEDKLNGVVTIDSMPLKMFNPMIPGKMARLDGSIIGNLSVSGTNKKPVMNGLLQAKNATTYIVPTSTTLRFDDKQIKMTKNKINFNKYKIYALGDNPFVIDGSIDATKFNRPMANLKMTATNMQLINAKKTPESLAYGKLFVNINSTLKGPLNLLQMRGNMRMLGNTNMTYVMLDSALEVSDSFNDLVTFTYFADTLPRRSRSLNFRSTARDMAMMSGMDILMNIRIDPIVRVKIDLDEEQSNRIELKGGGDLSFKYTPQGDMSLNGRYTLSEGALRYDIPVIPITNFSIKDGSYVDWSGDPMNPNLNITAYTKVRSSVDLDGQSRMVDFNAGIKIKDKLDNMSVQFLLEAPNDVNVQNQLIAMGEEERSKQAMSLLVAGVYLAGDGTGMENIDVGAALSSLLQREINNMLGSLMGEVPISFDVNTYDGTNGMGRRIDYIGRFYKGFFNERLYTTFGLRYSTKDPVYGNKLLLDDVSFEYRIDTDGARSIKLFRNKDYENIFEGEIAKMGASFTLRRKTKRFLDMFIFKKQKPLILTEDDEKSVEDEMEGVKLKQEKTENEQ